MIKYCINYNQFTQNLKCINKVDEWTIEYNSKDETLLEFLELHKDKRINLDMCKEDKIDADFIKNLAEKFNNLYFKVKYEQLENIKLEKRCFTDIYVNNWDNLLKLLDKNVSDVYIVENMGFELDKIAEMAHQKGIAIRVFPNVAQSQWKEISALKKFFIRPEDVDFYAQYVDTFEFYGEDRQMDVYYRVYSKDKKWFGQLNELIIDFNSDIDNKYIIPRFAEKRIKCDRKCLKGSLCSRCDRIEELSSSLEKSGLIVKIDNKE